MTIAHSMQLMNVKENIILWIICSIHIVADIFIVTDRIKDTGIHMNMLNRLIHYS